MKYFAQLAFLFLVTSNSLAQPTETDQLIGFVEKYEAAWQFHDAKQLAAFFSADCDMIVGVQPRVSGRAAIEQWWNNYFSRLDSGRMIKISIDSVRLLRPDVALLNVDTITAGIHSETNEALERRKARGTWLVIRDDGEWEIAALRAHSPIGELREKPGTDR